jgi:hypothetical protein
MGLISAIIVGFVVFILIQYFAPGLSTLVAVLIAGFIAGMLVEGLLKGLFVGLVISVIGILIVMFFFGGLPGYNGTTTGDIIGSLLGALGIGIIVLSSIAGLAGGALRRSKAGK